MSTCHFYYTILSLKPKSERKIDFCAFYFLKNKMNDCKTVGDLKKQLKGIPDDVPLVYSETRRAIHIECRRYVSNMPMLVAITDNKNGTVDFVDDFSNDDYRSKEELLEKKDDKIAFCVN